MPTTAKGYGDGDGGAAVMGVVPAGISIAIVGTVVGAGYSVTLGGTLVAINGYRGIPWLKNVFVMIRDYWDLSLSTPFAGQLFPTGGNSGGPGQVYPY